MAFPVVGSRNNSVETANTTTSTVSLPANLVLGDGILIAMGIDGGDAIDTPSGYSVLWDTGNNGSHRSVGFYKKAGASEPATIDITHGSEQTTHRTWRLETALTTDWDSVPPQASFITGVGTDMDPPSFDPDWTGGDDTRWIAFMSCDDNEVVDVFPTSYGDTATQDTLGSNSVTDAIAERNVSTGGAENPSLFSIVSTTPESFTAVTIAIPPSGATAGAGGATVEQEDWRWYENDAATPTISLAAEGTKPTLDGDQNYTILRLRAELRETGGGADTNKVVKLEMTEDGTNYFDIPLVSVKDAHITTADGLGVNGATIAARVLPASDVSGEYHEDQNGTESLTANDRLEVDFALLMRVILPDTDYTFRLVWDGTVVPVISGGSAIQLRGSTAATREADGVKNTIALLDNQDDPDPATLSHGHHKKGFYDGARWWAFLLPDEGVNSISYHETTDLAAAWSAESTIAMTTGGYEDWSVVFKEVGGTKYVMLATRSSSTTWRLKRGTISGATITWDGTERSVTVPPSDASGSPNIVIDDADDLWFVGTDISANEIWAQSSVNPITNATYYTFNTAKTLSETMGGGAKASGDSIDLAAIGSGEVLCVWNQASSDDVRAAKVSETSGFGSAQNASVTALSHSNDWGIVSDGTDVYLIHGDDTVNAYDWVLRVYSISGDSWSTGTTPSVVKAGSDATANDGIMLHSGDDGLIYAFGTFAPENRDTRIKYKTYTGGASGTWSSLLDLTPTSPTFLGNADSLNLLVDGAKAVVLLERGDDQIVNTFYVLEYYFVSTGAAGALTLTWDAATSETDTPADWSVVAAGAVPLTWDAATETDTPTDWIVAPAPVTLLWDAASETDTPTDWSVAVAGAATLVWNTTSETDTPTDWLVVVAGAATLVWDAASETDTPADWIVAAAGAATLTWDTTTETGTPTDWSVVVAGAATLTWDGITETDTPTDWIVAIAAGPAPQTLVWEGTSETDTPTDWSLVVAGAATLVWEAASETDTPVDWSVVAAGAATLVWDGANETDTPTDWIVAAAGAVTLTWDGTTETDTPVDWSVVVAGAATLVWEAASETDTPTDWIVLAAPSTLTWDGTSETDTATDWIVVAAGAATLIWDGNTETDTPADWIVAAAGAVTLTWDGTSETDTPTDWSVVVAGAATLVWDGVSEVDTPADWSVVGAGAATLTWDGITETDTSTDWIVAIAGADAQTLVWDTASETDTSTDWSVVVAGAATLVWDGANEVDTAADWLLIIGVIISPIVVASLEPQLTHPSAKPPLTFTSTESPAAHPNVRPGATITTRRN